MVRSQVIDMASCFGSKEPSRGKERRQPPSALKLPLRFQHARDAQAFDREVIMSQVDGQGWNTRGRAECVDVEWRCEDLNEKIAEFL